MSATSSTQLPNADVPIIDMSPLFGSDNTSKRKISDQIHKVCHTGHGFFLVSGHRVEVLKEFFDITKQFHMRLTDEERKKLAIVAYNSENTKQVRNGYYLAIPGKKAVESFCYLNPEFTSDHPMIKANVPMHEVNVWPDQSKYPGFKEFQELYYRKIFTMTSVLLRGFALALGKEENFFENYFNIEDTLSSIRLIRYPYLDPYPPVSVAADGTKISFATHEDVSLITVLYQPHVDNLQVETPTGYQNIPSSNDCFLVNAGGFMAHMTRNYFPAPLHRVKWVNAERLSLPFFANLGYHSKIEPFAPNNAEGLPAKPTITFGEYFEKSRQELIVKNGQT